MKNLLLSALILTMHFFVSAQIPIVTARSLPLGSTVTVTGIVTNGAELGTIRYIQDGTAGIAIFSSQLATAQRGDEITVTGVTTEFQNLLEIQPVNSWSLISGNNFLPAPVLLTPNQLGENYESQLVTINNVMFSNPGSFFQGNTNISFTSNGEPGVVYLRNGHPLVGTMIPSSQVTLTGILSQYQNQYQLLLRDANDISSSSSVSITIQPYATNITTSSLDINWETNVVSSTIVEYGKTPSLELGYLSTFPGTTHAVTITNALPSEVYYARAISVAGTDTAFSSIKVFITASLSTGNIKVYFNRPVDNSVAYTPANTAIYLNNVLADTIAAYINRAQNSIDISIYNFSQQGTQVIIDAINSAYLNGINIRIITEGSNTNSALASLNTSIPVLQSPIGSNYGLMHNKFMIIDADASNPDLPVVLTGSTNWTNSQLNTDRNNAIFIQDQSLSLAYKMEFEEMWGSSTMTPDLSVSRFGQYKIDNTPHQFVIGGKKVELYFSPSDHTNNHLIDKINSANDQLFFALLVFTRFDVATAIASRTTNGVYTVGILNDTGNGGSQIYNIIQSSGSGNLILYDHTTQSGILHHKYMIADQNNNFSDPLVWTGSHNWSTTANTRNDENTLVIYDLDIANQYYQEFVKLYNESGGVLTVNEPDPDFKNAKLYPNPATGAVFIEFVAEIPSVVKLTIIDTKGRKILTEPHKIISGKNVLLIDTSSLGNGMYFIDIQSATGTANAKLIISR